MKVVDGVLTRTVANEARGAASSQTQSTQSQSQSTQSQSQSNFDALRPQLWRQAWKALEVSASGGAVRLHDELLARFGEELCLLVPDFEVETPDLQNDAPAPPAPSLAASFFGSNKSPTAGVATHGVAEFADARLLKAVVNIARRLLKPKTQEQSSPTHPQKHALDLLRRAALLLSAANRAAAQAHQHRLDAQAASGRRRSSGSHGDLPAADDSAMRILMLLLDTAASAPDDCFSTLKASPQASSNTIADLAAQVFFKIHAIDRHGFAALQNWLSQTAERAEKTTSLRVGWLFSAMLKDALGTEPEAPAHVSPTFHRKSAPAAPCMLAPRNRPRQGDESLAVQLNVAKTYLSQPDEEGSSLRVDLAATLSDRVADVVSRGDDSEDGSLKVVQLFLAAIRGCLLAPSAPSILRSNAVSKCCAMLYWCHSANAPLGAKAQASEALWEALRSTAVRSTAVSADAVLLLSVSADVGLGDSDEETPSVAAVAKLMVRFAGSEDPEVRRLALKVLGDNALPSFIRDNAEMRQHISRLQTSVPFFALS
ncbi:hypothetical protein M885DRAFT_497568 [Pelagophyceae sp. CCMP2097]|nr:hypothetical protein M885DRAFT_497568 [Pelagophyceae sp. CCMP2097]